MLEFESKGGSGLCRRAVIGAPAAPAVVPVKLVGAPGSTATRCAAIVALQNEIEYPHVRYGDLESWLCSTFNWFKLSEEAQRTLPEAAEFHAVADRIPKAIQDPNLMLRQAARDHAQDMADVIGKIAVAACCVAIGGEDETTPAILNGVLRELQRLNCPACGAPLATHSSPVIDGRR
jgi:hypothetical protein